MASTSNTGRKRAFDGIAPSASTSASKRTQKPCYDVFINHRGPDVKHTLASVLHGILTAISLSVFLDSEESEYGDFLPRTIEAAMTSALIHIAIFSKRYAESPWCLAELSFMLQSGAKIIPIFYHVDPGTDLRWVDKGKGMYVQAFDEYERKGRYSPEKLQEWKSALHKVSFYHGQVINTKEDEARLMKNIVNIVLKEKKNEPFVVAKHPVGLDEIVEDFKVNTLQSAHADQDAQIVGIWGMGGSGKTTLAKQLYNEISSSMERSSLVFNVRDAATKGLLHEKQKVLLGDLGIHYLEFDNTEEGMRSLLRGLRSVKVLIILDDVDNIEQLDVLLPTKESLGRGSVIIVTTRSYAVLKAWGISTIYKMRPLNSLYAKQLFCWHAFLKSYPQNGFKELVEKFLEVCQGLPLSLKIFGAQLYGESRKEFWESLLQDISKILSDDIKKILKISYDALNNEEKEMFVDVACFFIGEESSLAIEVWNGLGWNGLWNWEGLLHKCLIELDNNNCITMHDHLRDLGRDIAKNQSPHRFWIPQQIDVQKQKKKEISIQGIITTSSQFFCNKHQKVVGKCLPLMVPKESSELDEFGVRCSHGKLVVNTNKGIWSLTPSSVGLKYLVINPEISRVTVIASERSLETLKLLSGLSRGVVWLRWFDIGLPKLPSEISLKNLRVLELREHYRDEEHHLEELWGEADSEGPVQLRQLHLHCCHKFKGFPKSIRHLNYLTKIVITEGYSVRSLPDEFCLIQSLEFLVLYRCSKLSSLPNNFGNLRNLRHLSLMYCDKLRRLPVSFQNLMLLEHLNLEWCGDLKFTSEDISFLESLTKLEYLNLSSCRQLEELPCPASLTELDFGYTSLRELPDNIGQLSKLREMEIKDMLLTCLPISLGHLSSLTRLSIRGCNNLERLPDSLGDLSSLTNLSIAYCPKLERLPDSLGDLSKLERQGVKSIGQLNNLQELSLSVCPMSNLKMIYLGQTGVCRISFSEDCCPHLESLWIFENHHLEEIEALPKTLQLIHLLDSEMLKSIPSLAGFTSLREFNLRGCDGIQKIEGLEDCTSLQVLTAETSWEVPGIESLEHLQNLKWLELRANKGSAIERCIQTIQKWPDEFMICARAVPDAASLVESLLSPSLVILDSISNHELVLPIRPYRGAELVLKSPSRGGAFMFCFVINCFSSQMTLTGGLQGRQGRHFSVKVEKGRWALVGVITQFPTIFKDDFPLQFRIQTTDYTEEGKVEKGLIVRGKEQTPVDAVRRLLPLLLQS